jgi:hypothetical protein
MLAPGATGWVVRCGSGPRQVAATLAEAAAIIPVGGPVQLALPAQTLVIERLTLPATQHKELAGMIRLQSEKSLPFPIEEVSSDFVMVARRSQESAVLSITAPHAALETLCLPLRERGVMPERVTPFVLHVAATCPADEIVLVVYGELGQLVVAVVEMGRLSWVQVLPTVDAERLVDELPQLLLPAIMEGVATTFSRVLLANDCAVLAPALREFFEVPVEHLPPAETRLTLAMNLAPASWQALKDRRRHAQRLRRGLLVAAALYLLLVIGAGLYLLWLRHQAASLYAQFAALRPQLELLQARQSRAAALGAAIDPHRFTVELLHLLLRNLPAESVRITEFDQTLDQWRIVGEAPSASLAIDYVSRIKQDTELDAYEITAAPPRLLPNEHAQFSIFGKR